MSYILFFTILFSSIALVVQYRRLADRIEKIREGCFIYLPYHAAPKFISLKERSFDLESIPSHFFLLLLLHEDDKFLTHKGFNRPELFRALKDCVLKRRLRGGSSITQQTAKSLFTKGNLSIKRKLIETIGAVALERHLTKEEILYLYLSNLRLISIVSGLPDILDYLLGINNLSDLSVAESELIVSLIPAPTSRINQIRKLGIAAFDIDYSYEKLLALTRIYRNKHMGESDTGFISHLKTVQSELMEYRSTCPVGLPNNEEIECIISATIILSHIQKSLNKIALRSPPKIGSKFFLAKWQLALICLLDDHRTDDQSLLELSEKDQGRIVFVARKNKVLSLLSERKVKLYALKLIEDAIKLEGDKNGHQVSLGIDTGHLIADLSKDELTDEDFCAPNFGKSIERFFSLK